MRELEMLQPWFRHEDFRACSLIFLWNYSLFLLRSFGGSISSNHKIRLNQQALGLTPDSFKNVQKMRNGGVLRMAPNPGPWSCESFGSFLISLKLTGVDTSLFAQPQEHGTKLIQVHAAQGLQKIWSWTMISKNGGERHLCQVPVFKLSYYSEMELSECIWQPRKEPQWKIFVSKFPNWWVMENMLQFCNLSYFFVFGAQILPASAKCYVEQIWMWGNAQFNLFRRWDAWWF